MKKILITGSEGLVGRVLQKNLTDDYELSGIDRKEKSDLKNYRVADIAQLEELASCWREFGGIDAVIHLAGDSFNRADWDFVLPANIIGTKNVFETARKNGVRKIVLASSGHVVGGWEKEIQESGDFLYSDWEVRPDGWYGLSKAFGEDLARMYHDKYGMQIYCLRIGAVLADDQPVNDRDKKIWLSHHDLTKIIRAMIESPVKFGIYFGVSDNPGRFWDIENLIEDFELSDYGKI